MKITAAVLLAIFMLQGPRLAAQEMTPRAYWPAPKGTRIATIGLSHVSGDTIPDPSLPIPGVDSDIATLQVGYLQTLSLLGRTANLILEVPYSDGDTVGVDKVTGKIKREYRGIGDVAATLSVNFMGAPSMDKQQFDELRRDPGPIFGGSLKLVAPTGKYDEDRLINVGANRWAMKAELGYIVPLNRKWLLEFDLGGWFFADNDDFLGFTKEQDPLASAQVHLVRRIRPGFWASLDSSFYQGGRSTVDGTRLDDLQRDSKLGFTVGYPVARGHVIKLNYSLGSVSDSREDFDILVLSYSRVF